MHIFKRGDVIKLKSAPRTYRFVEKVDQFYIYTRKPNKTPHKIPIYKSSNWELLK